MSHEPQFIDAHEPAWPSIDEWRAAGAPAGGRVSVANTLDPESLRADLPRLAAIGLHFPKWTDGRAYSQARLLRVRLRFAGEIRATGDVVVDMVPLLVRTGFDAVQLRDGQQPGHARRALGFFDGHYQGDVHEPRPWFARAA